MPRQPITADLVRAALAAIPANLPRDEWVRIGMAIKSEFPGDDGFSLFDEWSAAGAGYNAKDCRAAWRSIRAAGAVSVGTLLREAQRNGFDVKTWPTSRTEPKQQRRSAGDRTRAEAEEASQQLARWEKAANSAATAWEHASETGESPYLARKGVQPYGVRFGAGGVLLVPLRDAEGKLWNVQQIEPEPPRAGPEKRFLAGGRKAGLWHWCGEAPARASAPPGAILVAEGYATAASLHEACRLPVAVAFDAGNLAHVAKAVRGQFPAAAIIVCGDDDSATEARTGNNPGRAKAAAAARQVKGVAIFPEGLPAGGSDFNDLHQAAGLEMVARQIEAAIDNMRAGARPPADAAASDAPGDGGSLDPFAVNEHGVWHCAIDQDGRRKAPEWVCSRLDVEALTRDQEGNSWGWLLTWADPLGTRKQWAMPARMLAGDGTEYRAILFSMGLRIAPSPRARNLLTQYIQTRQPEEFASCTDRVGWHSRAFVLPRETICGEGHERIVFQSESQIENTMGVRGSPAHWRERVAALCVGNSRLLFGVAAAFAGPLLRPAGMESGGAHFRGDSSSGKTTILKVAASVYGGENYVQRWRATSNSIEGMAAQHSDLTLILDELAQVDAREAGEIAYMLSNGQGKGRSTRTGLPRPRLSWRLLFLSSGELGLADHMAEGMRRTRTGQEVRMVDIPADAGVGLGAFESLHGFEGGSAFSRHICAQAAAAHGAVGRAWLHWLCENVDGLRDRVREGVSRLSGQLVPEGASGQVERVAARFALIGVAGELATAAGLTGWPEGDSERAARACFNAWLAARGGTGNGEVVAMLRAVRRFLEVNAEGRFAMWHRGADDHAPKTLNRAGVRRMLNADGEPIKTNGQHGVEFGERMQPLLGEGVSFEYFVLPETFRSEVCQGYDYQAVARVLLAHGCLKPDKGRAFDTKQRLPGIGPTRCYCIPPAIFALDL